MNRRSLSKQLLIFTIISSLTVSNAWADCPNAVVYHVGDKVTDCDRIGLNLDTERTVREKVVEGEFNAQIVKEQKKMIDLKDLAITDQSKQVDLWKGETTRQKDRADTAEEKKGRDFMWGLLAGVALTALSGWALGQAARN